MLALSLCIIVTTFKPELAKNRGRVAVAQFVCMLIAAGYLAEVDEGQDGGSCIFPVVSLSS